jgi:hypothetical protein
MFSPHERFMAGLQSRSSGPSFTYNSAAPTPATPSSAISAAQAAAPPAPGTTSPYAPTPPAAATPATPATPTTPATPSTGRRNGDDDGGVWTRSSTGRVFYNGYPMPKSSWNNRSAYTQPSSGGGQPTTYQPGTPSSAIGAAVPSEWRNQFTTWAQGFPSMSDGFDQTAFSTWLGQRPQFLGSFR